MSLFRNILTQKAMGGGGDNYLNMPITFQNVSQFGSNRIVLMKNGQPNQITCFCKINNGGWSPYEVGSQITLQNVGDKVSFYCTTTTFSSSDFAFYYFQISQKADVYGNIMSLVQGNRELTSLKTIENDQQFGDLFSQYPHDIRNACNLQLPATTLSNQCYVRMFSDCSSLITSPVLPATNLANYCYYVMFYGCTSLTTAPDLPATTLYEGCYSNMFSFSALTTAPELPATNLADYCYYEMFYGCTRLTTAPDLPATTLYEGCYSNMFQFSALTTAPELPATTLAPYCYYRMFRATQLTNLNVNFSQWGNNNQTVDWFEFVSEQTGTFTCPTALGNNQTIQRGQSFCPEGWTVVNK